MSTTKWFSFRNVSIILLIAYFAIFLIYPVFRAFLGSFHDWNPLIQQFDFIGWENYSYILSDSLFWSSISNTLVFTFFSTLFRVVIGLGLALLLFSKMTKFRTAFQGLFYMPTITPLVAVSFVWMWMFDPQFGLINKVFNLDINWLKDSTWALPAIIIMTVWKDFGYATVLFLAGMMGLPDEVYEASTIDGANSWQTFRHITAPLLKPTTIFVVITSLISYLQAYIQILIMTKGDQERLLSSSLILYLMRLLWGIILERLPQWRLFCSSS